MKCIQLLVRWKVKKRNLPPFSPPPPPPKKEKKKKKRGGGGDIVGSEVGGSSAMMPFRYGVQHMKCIQISVRCKVKI